MREVASDTEMQMAGLYSAPTQGNRPSHGLIVQFYKKSMKDEKESIEKGRPIFKPVDYIEIRIPGDKDHIIDTEVWDDYMNANSHTSRFPFEWQRYQANKEQSIEVGTPLRALTLLAVPILTPEQVEEFKAFKVTTAEQLLSMSDSMSQKFMGINEIKRKIALFIDAAASNAPAERLRSELDKRDNEISMLKQALQEQSSRLDKITASTEKRK